jgi:hypothetical protein
MNPLNTNTLEPRDLAFLQQFFHAACAERGLSDGSTAASNLAAEIIALYQNGVRDEKDLQIKLQKNMLGRN